MKKQNTQADREVWQAQYEAALEASLPEEEAREIAEHLHSRKAWQFSRKPRIVATLPEGKTALEALRSSAPSEYRRVMQQAESWARDAYGTYCAKRDGEEHKLDVRTFKIWKELQDGQFQTTITDLRNASEKP